MTAKADQVIRHEDHEYRVLGTGASRDGKTYCHLASTTLGRQQTNGWVPQQIGDWVANEVLEAANA